jgi:hypothetical protein
MLSLLADAGYDSEGNHELCRDEHGILTLIPPTHGRPTTKPAKGRNRRMMQTRFNKKRYGQRWQVETTISMIKRLQGSATKGRSYHARRRDMMLMVLTHNIMILSPIAVIVIQIKVFYRAGQNYLSLAGQTAAGLDIAMPRPLRPIADGLVYHVINRGNNRQSVFDSDGDFRAFLKAIADLKERMPFYLYG